MSVSLTADTNKFSRGMERGRRGVRGFSSSVQKSTAALKRMAGALAGLVAGRAMVNLIKNTLGEVDAAAKMADRLGLATEKLMGLRHAADLSGVKIAALEMGLQRMVRRIAEAAQGTGEAKGALIELGLSAQQLAQMSPDQQFYALADAMQRVEQQGDRVRLAMKLFDSEGVALVNMLRDGSAGLANMQAEAERLGLTFTGTTADGVEAANDAMTRMRGAMKGLIQTLAVRLAPTIERAADKIKNLVIAARSMNKATVASIANAAKWVAGITAAVVIVPRVVAAFGMIIKAIRAMTRASVIAQAFAGPSGWASLAAGAAIATASIAGLAKAYGGITAEMDALMNKAEQVGAAAKAGDAAKAGPAAKAAGASGLGYRRDPEFGLGVGTTGGKPLFVRDLEAIERLKRIERDLTDAFTVGP